MSLVSTLIRSAVENVPFSFPIKSEFKSRMSCSKSNTKSVTNEHKPIIMINVIKNSSAAKNVHEDWMKMLAKYPIGVFQLNGNLVKNVLL